MMSYFWRDRENHAKFICLSEGVADLKSSHLYENLPEQRKMAILSRRLILLAILLYEQLKHHRQT